MLDVLFRPTTLIILSGLGYAAATLAMKAASSTPSLIAISAIGLCLCLAVLAEVLLLQRTDLGLAYIAVLAAETTIIVLVASAIGEGLGLRDLAGGALVLFGAAVLST